MFLKRFAVFVLTLMIEVLVIGRISLNHPRRFICKLIGHKRFVEIKVGYGWECPRCNEQDYDAGSDPTIPEMLDGLKFRLTRRIRRWLGRCQYCGRRFCTLPNDDAHDDYHIPF